MKAAELLRLYEAGRRDFSGESLRGENFKGKDLSDADFSRADIRSTNFTNTNLTRAKFNEAKAGLQRRWVTGVIIASCLLSAVSGFFSAFAGFGVLLIFDSINAESQVIGWVVLATIVIFVFLILRKGIGALTIAMAMTIAIAVIIAGAIAGAIVEAIVEAGAITLLGTLITAGTIVLTIAGTVAGALTTAIVLTIAGALTIVLPIAIVGAIAIVLTVGGVGVGAIAIVIVLTLASPYVGWRALKGDGRDAWIRSVAIAFAAIGGTSFRGATLTDADFSHARLKSTDFRRSVLLRTCWRDAEKLDRVRPGETYLNNPKICELLSTGNGQGQSYDHLLNLVGLHLQRVNLTKADFTSSTLKTGTLQGATLNNTYFIGTDLNQVNLQGANLSNAQLIQTQLDQADLTGATLTGACIEDWNVNASTNLADVTCDYVYLKSNQRERRPSQGTFQPGEFAALFQQAVNTVDLIFKDGIDWQAFFQSFQDLCSQYSDQDLAIQAIEKKRDGAFIIRVEVPPGADKPAIESSAKELYETKLVLLEQRYRAELKAKDGEIISYREQSTNLMKITEMLAARPPMSEGNKYDLRGAQFGGGYVAGNVEGSQYGGIINNYGSNTEDITRLLTALRDQAQTFPTDQKDDANDALDDLERDLKDDQPDQGRIGRRLKRLVALGAAIGTIASGAAAVSGDVSTFTGNVIELTEQLGIPVEQVQLPPGTP